MKTAEQKKEIAQTILNQLGGNMFLMMTGSKNLLALESGLRMNLTRNKAGAKFLYIELDSMDTYTMTFKKMRKDVVSDVAKYEGLYFDQLRPIFEEVTHLYTSL